MGVNSEPAWSRLRWLPREALEAVTDRWQGKAKSNASIQAFAPTVLDSESRQVAEGIMETIVATILEAR
jgi:hypothetical protein